MTDRPDHVDTHEPGRCAGCGAGLSGAEMTATERRQVVDLPEEIQAVVTEHRIVSRRCPCGMVASGTAPAGVNAPVQYGPRLSAVAVYLWHGQFLSRDRACQAVGELFGVPVSPGAVAGMVRRAARMLDAPLAAIRRALIGATGRVWRDTPWVNWSDAQPVGPPALKGTDVVYTEARTVGGHWLDRIQFRDPSTGETRPGDWALWDADVDTGGTTPDQEAAKHA